MLSLQTERDEIVAADRRDVEPQPDDGRLQSRPVHEEVEGSPASR